MKVRLLLSSDSRPPRCFDRAAEMMKNNIVTSFMTAHAHSDVNMDYASGYSNTHALMLNIISGPLNSHASICK